MGLASSEKHLHEEDLGLSYESLMEKNEEHKNHFRNNQLFFLMKNGYFISPEKRELLLSYLQIWSTYFQKIMMLRTALCDDPAFNSLFEQHLAEEFGHDQILLKDRISKRIHHDEIIEAISCWFYSKSLSFTPYEQLVMINLCLEGASNVFNEYAGPAIDPQKRLNYLKLHESLDEGHETMGNYLLKNLTVIHYNRLLHVLDLSWKMIGAMMKRLAELTTEE